MRGGREREERKRDRHHGRDRAPRLPLSRGGSPTAAGTCAPTLRRRSRSVWKPERPRVRGLRGVRLTADPESPSPEACPRCGRSIPPDAPRGNCPSCLLHEVDGASQRGPRAASDRLVRGAGPFPRRIGGWPCGGLGLLEWARDRVMARLETALPRRRAEPRRPPGRPRAGGGAREQPLRNSAAGHTSGRLVDRIVIVARQGFTRRRGSRGRLP
jgi:hypothetical protein